MTGWIGVDLDGTLAMYHEWVSPSHIGNPIPKMIERVKRWRKDGIDVRIITARVSNKDQADEARDAIEKWCMEFLGEVLVITHMKDYEMLELWDDRCVQVETNTGKIIGASTRGLSNV